MPRFASAAGTLLLVLSGLPARPCLPPPIVSWSVNASRAALGGQTHERVLRSTVLYGRYIGTVHGKYLLKGTHARALSYLQAPRQISSTEEAAIEVGNLEGRR